MKRISTLFLMAFMSIIMFAQDDVLLTEIWHNSTRSTAIDLGGGYFQEGTKPSWMGNTSERGMTVANGKVYVASRANGQDIIVLDGMTGNLLNTITLPADPVSGGTFPINSIDATASGNLVLCNLAVNTQATDEVSGDPIGQFKAYHIELNANGDDVVSITNIVNWHNVGDTENPAFRIGDGIAFYGDIATGSNGYLVMAAAASNYILRWNVTDGVVSADPVFYKVADVEGTPVNFATAPQVEPVSDNLVIVDGNNMFPIAYDMSSADPMALETVASFSGSVTPQTSNMNGVAYFEYDGRYFMSCVTNYWNDALAGVPINSFEAFEFVDGDWAQATSLGFLPSTGLSAVKTTTNVSFAYPTAVEVLADKVMIYVMSANMGIAGYELTTGNPTAIGDVDSDKVKFYPNPSSDLVTFSTVMATVEIYDLAGKLVKKANGVTELGVSELNGLYLLKGTSKNGLTIVEKLVVK